MPAEAAPIVPAQSRLHFSMRDLLLFVALAAIYLSAAVRLDQIAAAARPFLLQGFLGFLGRPSTFTIVFAIGLGVMFWREDRKSILKLGAKQVCWRRSYAWTVSFLLAAVGLVAALGVAPLFPITHSSIGAGLGGLLGMTLYVFSPIRIGENGVSYQMGIFFPWSRFDVELNEADSTLTLKSSETRWKWEHRLAIPVERLEEVEEILRESGKLPSLETHLAPGDSPGAKWG